MKLLSLIASTDHRDAIDVRPWFPEGTEHWPLISIPGKFGVADHIDYRRALEVRAAKVAEAGWDRAAVNHEPGKLAAKQARAEGEDEANEWVACFRSERYSWPMLELLRDCEAMLSENGLVSGIYGAPPVGDWPNRLRTLARYTLPLSAYGRLFAPCYARTAEDTRSAALKVQQAVNTARDLTIYLPQTVPTIAALHWSPKYAPLRPEIAQVQVQAAREFGTLAIYVDARQAIDVQRDGLRMIMEQVEKQG